MSAINLIPPDRLDRLARLHWRRRWTAICIGYAVVAVVACFAIRLSLLGSSHDYGAEVTRLSGRVGQLNETIGRLGGRVARQQRALGASRLVGPQPDWSVPLAALAEAAEGSIVMTRCTLLSDGVADEVTGDPAEYVLELTGLGETRADVLDFVLELERRALFSAVSLHSSRRMSVDGREMTVFVIDGRFGREGER